MYHNDTAPGLRVHARSGSLKWCLDNFILDARARDLADDSIDFYRRKLRPFMASLVEQGISRVGNLEPRNVQTYMISLREEGKSPGNIHRYAGALRTFLHWCADNELIDRSICRAFKMPRQPKVERAAFTVEQLSQLLAAASHTACSERDQAIISLMADVGLRAGEVGRIRDAECDLDRLLVHGKGRRERYAPLAPTTRKAIQKWRKHRGSSEWLFLSVRDEPMDRQTIYKLFRRLGKLADISPCHPHMMRRTTAVEWIRAGGDTFTLQQLLGHSSQTMTKVYVEMADDDVAMAHRRLSLMERLKKRG